MAPPVHSPLVHPYHSSPFRLHTPRVYVECPQLLTERMRPHVPSLLFPACHPMPTVQFGRTKCPCCELAPTTHWLQNWLSLQVHLTTAGPGFVDPCDAVLPLPAFNDESYTHPAHRETRVTLYLTPHHCNWTWGRPKQPQLDCASARGGSK